MDKSSLLKHTKAHVYFLNKFFRGWIYQSHSHFEWVNSVRIEVKRWLGKLIVESLKLIAGITKSSINQDFL